MAHFARLDENNIVQQVIVVGNADTSDAFGVEKEHIGAAFCERLLGGTWKQTSYNNNMRHKFAGIGDWYNEELDVFMPPQPFPSWTLNTETYTWNPPAPRPEYDKLTQKIVWNEELLIWTIQDR